MVDHDDAIQAVLTAVATASLSGPLALQGIQAARGLEVWASRDDIHLEIVDDASSAAVAYDLYQRWVDTPADIVLGPYGSGLVRKVAPLVSGRGVPLWNHGGAADDLARPLLISVPAPASTYFHGAVEISQQMGLREVVLAGGNGRFASAVVSGARRKAIELGMGVRGVPTDWAAARSLAEVGILFVGSFADDVTNVARIRAQQAPGLLGCVAAGLQEFGDRLGRAADLVVGPVQWTPRPALPEIGPSGTEFALGYQRRFGEPAGYVAAQAAAAGFLGAEARRRGFDHDHIRRWQTSTLLGSFALDQSWRQAAHAAITIQWRNRSRVVVR
jgi:ABC-type branched-subunit amino acid transport system substrate-binding protein